MDSRHCSVPSHIDSKKAAAQQHGLQVAQQEPKGPRGNFYVFKCTNAATFDAWQASVRRQNSQTVTHAFSHISNGNMESLSLLRVSRTSGRHDACKAAGSAGAAGLALIGQGVYWVGWGVYIGWGRGLGPRVGLMVCWAWIPSRCTRHRRVLTAHPQMVRPLCGGHCRLDPVHKAPAAL